MFLRNRNGCLTYFENSYVYADNISYDHFAAGNTLYYNLIISGVFSDKMKGRVRYGRPNKVWGKQNNSVFLLFAIIL